MIARAVGLLVLCAAVGGAVVERPTVLAVLAGIAVVAGVYVASGREKFTLFLLALLPWLVLFLNVTPNLTLTVASGAAAVLLLGRTSLRSEVAALPWTAVMLFALIVIAEAIESTHGGRFIEAAKYALFPAMVLVISSPSNRSWLRERRVVLLGSGAAAMAVDEFAILLHLGSVGSYYGVGEQLGLTAESPHEIALIGVMVAIACLLTVRDYRLRLIGAAVATVPALATGVRSPLVALAVALVVLAARSGFRIGTLMSIAVICAAVIFSGAGSIIAARYSQSVANGEFTSFSSAGSDRGAVWTTAVDYWAASGPIQVVFGEGLRSVEAIENAHFGESVTAQSDFVATLVELGLVGLLAWLLMWLAVIRSGADWLVALPLASYALTNGSLEYVGAVVFGLALAAACGNPPSASPEREPAATL
jgi:hypothetical protein